MGAMLDLQQLVKGHILNHCKFRWVFYQKQPRLNI